MDSIDVKRLDHHGVVASVIDDLKLVDIIDEWPGLCQSSADADPAVF
jgi:hypothetical protein